MLKVANLSVSIGAVPILLNVSLELTTGQTCGLIGRNGAGKTTFMRSLMGALPATGTAELAGTNLLSLPPHRRITQGIGYMPQDRRLVPEFTAEENIRLPSWAAALPDVDQRLDWIFAVMPEVARLRGRRAFELSGGQQKMVALARALMAGRRMLLLDEPFEGLAPALVRQLSEGLTGLKAQTVSLLISESTDVHVGDLFERVYRIERGRVTRA
jgi:branched-chain amino acid transport system ATP-binding protein